MAQLAPAPVQLRLLQASLERHDPAGPANRLLKAIADLWDLSLVGRSELGEPAAHRLILAFVRHLPESGSSRMQTATAVENEMARAWNEQDMASFQELEAVCHMRNRRLRGRTWR